MKSDNLAGELPQATRQLSSCCPAMIHNGASSFTGLRLASPAMNHKALFSSASDRWATPRELYAALDNEFAFNFDPCPLDAKEDGLLPLFCQWRGKRVFCNPPYGRGIGEWLKRGREAEVAVFLLPARTDTRWFHELVLPHAREIRFCRGRLKFGGATNPAPFPSMVVVFGQN